MAQNYSNGGPTSETRIRIPDSTPLDNFYVFFGWRYRRNDVIFVLSCSVGFLVDPLFFYIWNINDDIKCLSADTRFRILFLVLRSLVDLSYVAAFIRNNCATSNCGHTSWVTRLVRSVIALPVALPFPQVILLTGGSFYTYTAIDARTCHAMFLKIVLDMCPFIFVAHVLGAIWYSSAIQRETGCWLKACHNITQCYPADIYDLFCKGRKGLLGVNRNMFPYKMNNISHIDRLCPTNPSNASVLDYGIYLDVIRFGTTRTTTNTGSKILNCFSGGLRNLSSLVSNLEPSKNVAENVFVISITIAGIILFLIYLNVNLQTYRQWGKMLARKKEFDCKMQMISTDIDLWLSKNADVPKSIKKVIMKTFEDTVKENKDVHVENFFSILSPVHKRLIMRPLCLDVLKKVPLLENMEEQVLKAISEPLNWVFYPVDSYIIREREPLGKMFFIRQGTAWTFTTRTRHIHGSTSGSSIIHNLEKDDLYGAELLEWAFNFGSISNLPVSTRTVVSQERVEAFVITAKDLKKIVSMFWWNFSKQLQLRDIEDSLLMELDCLPTASCSRCRKATVNRGTRGGNNVVNNMNKLIKSD